MTIIDITKKASMLTKTIIVERLIGNGYKWGERVMTLQQFINERIESEIECAYDCDGYYMPMREWAREEAKMKKDIHDEVISQFNAYDNYMRYTYTGGNFNEIEIAYFKD